MGKSTSLHPTACLGLLVSRSFFVLGQARFRKPNQGVKSMDLEETDWVIRTQHVRLLDVTLDKSLNFSELQFLHQSNAKKNTCCCKA